MTVVRVILVIGGCVILWVNSFHMIGDAEDDYRRDSSGRSRNRESRSDWHYLTKTVDRYEPFGFVISISPRRCSSCPRATSGPEPEKTTALLPEEEDSAEIATEFRQFTTSANASGTTEGPIGPWSGSNLLASTPVASSTTRPKEFWINQTQNDTDRGQLNETISNDFVDEYSADYEESGDDDYGDLSLPGDNVTGIQ